MERAGDGSVTRRRGKASLDKDLEDWRSRLKLSVEGVGSRDQVPGSSLLQALQKPLPGVVEVAQSNQNS